MAKTEDLFTGDGSTTKYSLTFEYLNEGDVKATTAAPNGSPSQAAFTFANATTIQFTAAPLAGHSVRIYRETANDNLIAKFFAGSAIRASDLNRNFEQTLFSVQEVLDRFIDRTQAVFQNNLNMSNFKIINLGDGTDDNDAVNKSQLDATQTHNDNELATTKTACETAQSDAEAAKTAAQTANTNANTAKTAAEAARDVAQQFATNAEDTAFSYNSANYNSALHWAAKAEASATAAAGTVEKAVFFGFKRDLATGNILQVEFNTGGDTTTYSPTDYTYKGTQHWFIGNNGLMHLSGPNINEPKFSFVNGHLLFELSA